MRVSGWLFEVVRAAELVNWWSRWCPGTCPEDSTPTLAPLEG